MNDVTNKQVRHFGLLHFSGKDADKAATGKRPVHFKGRNIWLGTTKHHVQLLGRSKMPAKSQETPKQKIESTRLNSIENEITEIMENYQSFNRDAISKFDPNGPLNSNSELNEHEERFINAAKDLNNEHKKNGTRVEDTDIFEKIEELGFKKLYVDSIEDNETQDDCNVDSIEANNEISDAFDDSEKTEFNEYIRETLKQTRPSILKGSSKESKTVIV